MHTECKMWQCYTLPSVSNSFTSDWSREFPLHFLPSCWCCLFIGLFCCHFNITPAANLQWRASFSTTLQLQYVVGEGLRVLFGFQLQCLGTPPEDIFFHTEENLESLFPEAQYTYLLNCPSYVNSIILQSQTVQVKYTTFPTRKSVSNSNNVPRYNGLGQLSSWVTSTTATVPALIVTPFFDCASSVANMKLILLPEQYASWKLLRGLSLQYINMLYWKRQSFSFNMLPSISIYFPSLYLYML